MAVKYSLVTPTTMFRPSQSTTVPTPMVSNIDTITITPPKKDSSKLSLTTSSTCASPVSGLPSPQPNRSTSNATNPLQRSIGKHRLSLVSQPRRLLHHALQQCQHRSIYGQGHPLMHQIQAHLRTNSQDLKGDHNNHHKKNQSIQLADKFQDVMSDPLLQGSLNGAAVDISETDTTGARAKGEEEQTLESDYVYTAPCEHHPSKGQKEYLHDLSTIEFGIRISDFMPLAFKTVPVAGLAERELELLRGLRDMPYVIQLQDSFVNDDGDTVLVLPKLRKFDCQTVNKSICDVRKTIKQVLTGLAAIHAKNIVHLDINPSNLMITHSERDVVIIDFGLSTAVDPSARIPVCGTTGYIAPEILNPERFYKDIEEEQVDVNDVEKNQKTLTETTTTTKYDHIKADMYSLGVILGEMLEPYIPDCDLHYFGSKYLTVENTNQTITYLKELISSQCCAYPQVLIQAADLLVCMLQENPFDRKSARDLLDSHPFLTTCLSKSNQSASASTETLELCDWTCRVQEIKYQKYLCQEREDHEVYRYR
ncbi:hypothetical protein BGZ76_001312 [Entomortierella beljakovae]|nr:hypothetical protein BGZ76_001312 [Entomortierella beljakovae]